MSEIMRLVVSVISEAGTLLATPPSTRKRPPIFIGGNTPGIEMEEIRAGKRGPLSKTTSSLLLMSVALKERGIFRSEKSLADKWFLINVSIPEVVPDFLPRAIALVIFKKSISEVSLSKSV